MPNIDLNQDQKEAVEYFSKKPLLIQAGPGSGKTRVIIERVKYLIQQMHINPETFLVVTFSKKASNELRERLIDSENGLDTETVNKIHISTIHSFCYDLISGKGLSYDILEEDEKNHMFIYNHLFDLGFEFEKYYKKGHVDSLVKKFNEMTTFNVDVDGFEEYVKDEFPVNSEYLDYIQSILNNLKADEYFNFPEEDVKDDELLSDAWYNARYNQIAESYRRYLNLLEKENYIDFSLIQTKALELLETYPDLVEELGFKNILIDEFQDTDPIQMKIFDHLIRNSETFTVVGDDDQSIYGFRGSDIKFFLEFQDNYDAELITLKTNYRSTRNIVDFCENFIEKDRIIKKELNCNPERTGENPEIFYIKSGGRNGRQDEADQIAGIIKHLKDSGKIANYSDVGILFRALMGGKALKLSLALEEYGIPYDIVGNEDLLEQAEIKALILMIYYLIESDDAPYIMNRWSGKGADWLNIYGFASKDSDLNKYFGFSEKTRKSLIKLEDDFREDIISAEKEVFKEITGQTSRVRKYFGVFDKYKNQKELKEACFDEIFKRVKKPYLYKFTVDDLRQMGIDDEHDLNFFKKLYDLRKSLEDERSDETIKDKTTLLDVFYQLMSILDNFDFDDFDDENVEKLLNVSELSNTIYKFEDVVSRYSLRKLFWFLYHNLGKHSSNQINDGNEVQIMTIHKSKGLEFPVVFIAGLKEKSFPKDFKDEELELYGLFKTPNFPIPYKYLEYKDELTREEKEEKYYCEERRVLYVGLTRAKEILILSAYEDKNGKLPEIDGIDFNQVSLKRIEDDYSIIPPIQINKVPEDEEEIPILSYTSIRDYEKCPFKYYVVHKLLFKVSDTFKIQKGNISHNILNKIHKESITGKTLEDVTEQDYIDEMIDEDEKELYQNEVENIKEYLNTFFKEIEIIKSEFPFTIEKNNYIINGQIDLIYKRNGTLGILDFKNKYAIDKEEVKNQLYTYLLALKLNPEFHDENIKELAVYLLKAPKDNKLRIFDIDEDYLNNFQNKITSVAQNINHNVFEKKQTRDCDNCSFSFICN